MGTAKLYFEDGIPEKQVIEKWVVDFGCFHTPEVVIKNSKDNKTMTVDFEESYFGMCHSWQSLFNASGAKWIYFFAKDDIGEGDSYYILHSDGQNIFSLTSSNESFLSKTLLEHYRFLKNAGFEREYRRFCYSSPNASEEGILLDYRVPDSYYIELFGDEEAKRMGIILK